MSILGDGGRGVGEISQRQILRRLVRVDNMNEIITSVSSIINPQSPSIRLVRSREIQSPRRIKQPLPHPRRFLHIKVLPHIYTSALARILDILFRGALNGIASVVGHDSSSM